MHPSPLVRVTGFEPAASCSQSRRATDCATPGYSIIQIRNSEQSPRRSALSARVAGPEKIFALSLLLDFFDRCPCSASLFPPLAALGSATQSRRATDCAKPGYSIIQIHNSEQSPRRSALSARVAEPEVCPPPTAPCLVDNRIIPHSARASNPFLSRAFKKPVRRLAQRVKYTESRPSLSTVSVVPAAFSPLFPTGRINIYASSRLVTAPKLCYIIARKGDTNVPLKT